MQIRRSSEDLPRGSKASNRAIVGCHYNAEMKLGEEESTHVKCGSPGYIEVPGSYRIFIPRPLPCRHLVQLVCLLNVFDLCKVLLRRQRWSHHRAEDFFFASQRTREQHERGPLQCFEQSKPNTGFGLVRTSDTLSAHLSRCCEMYSHVSRRRCSARPFVLVGC